MKKIIFLLLTIVFCGLLISGGAEYPQITDLRYGFEYRKGSTDFIDFIWEVDIQGTYRPFKMWLEINLYDSNKNQIETFGRIIEIESDSLQTFNGRKIMPIKMADKIQSVTGNLGVLNKKY